jgi:hypothetical protein
MSAGFEACRFAVAVAVMGWPAQAKDSPDWLVGAWVSETDKGWTEEWWTPARGGLMLGATRSGAGDTLRDFEHSRIVLGADGRYAFHAQPGGAPTVAFVEEKRAAGAISFVNPNHDYPQRVSYRREGETIVATISLMDGSKPVSWTYRRR